MTLLCGSKDATLYKGQKQLSRSSIDTARQLSRVRIRVIGVVRQKYTILESKLAINMIMCDKETNTSVIVVVCSALCNFCDSVVPIL